MARLNNMCRAALVLFTISWLVDFSVFKVMNEQIFGTEEAEYDVKDPQDNYYESMYGDFESMIADRRRNDRLLLGVEAQASDEDFTDIPGVIIRKSYTRKGVRESLRESQQKMNEMALKYQKQEAGFTNFTGRENYANGFVEEYYDSQICTR